MAKNNQFCYMCGKSVNEVNKLIKGEYGYICDSCISIASDLLNDEEEESITNNMQLATPSQIKAHLDQYVIGQDEAKRTLAVRGESLRNVPWHDPEQERIHLPIHADAGTHESRVLIQKDTEIPRRQGSDRSISP